GGTRRRERVKWVPRGWWLSSERRSMRRATGVLAGSTSASPGARSACFAALSWSTTETISPASWRIPACLDRLSGRLMLSAVMPMYARLIFPSCISLSTTPLTVLTGTEIPRLLAYAALIPIIRPLASTSGPPEYPGLRRASETTTLSIDAPHHPRTLYAGLVTIPDVALGCLPKGLLTARTDCPTFSLSEFP